jgi:hypothetical protein
MPRDGSIAQRDFCKEELVPEVQMLASSLRDSTMGRRALLQMKCMSSEAEVGWQFIYGTMFMHFAP